MNSETLRNLVNSERPVREAHAFAARPIGSSKEVSKAGEVIEATYKGAFVDALTGNNSSNRQEPTLDQIDVIQDSAAYSQAVLAHFVRNRGRKTAEALRRIVES